jgi:hypothetical protein
MKAKVIVIIVIVAIVLLFFVIGIFILGRVGPPPSPITPYSGPSKIERNTTTISSTAESLTSYGYG